MNPLVALGELFQSIADALTTAADKLEQKTKDKD